MGGKYSKNRKKRKSENDHADFVSTDTNKEDQYVQYLRYELENNIEEFLLNNLLMSFQFFENYERDVTQLRSQPNQTSNYETSLNERLLQYQKSCLLPDLIAELVNERVRFCPVHGPKKNICETLVPQRIFIHHENIEIESPFNESDYSNAGGTVYRCVIKDIKKVVNEVTKREENTGYIKLQKIGEIPRDSSPVVPPKEGSPLSPKRSPQFLKNSPSTPKSPAPRSPALKENKFIFPTQRSSSFLKRGAPKEQEEVEYEYSTLHSLTTKRSLMESRLGQITDFGKLPGECFYLKKKLKDGATIYDDSSDEDEEKGDEAEENEEKEEVQKVYLKSKEFFQHFQQVFQHISAEMSFSEFDKRKAEWQGSIIYINKETHPPNFDIRSLVMNYEIYPAILTNITFPQEFINRYRPTQDLNRKSVHFPTKKMIQIIKSYGVSILPMGRLAKRGLHQNSDIEWTIAFPKVERYLQVHLSHPQMRAYLFILTLFKSFIEIENPQLGLNTYHIRTILYWLFEENWKDWQEITLGSKIIKVLEKIKFCLSDGKMEDYFIRQKNLFESTPSKYLRISQERIHRILERPFIYTLVALRNLKYTNTNYPLLDLKQLYRIISISNPLGLINRDIQVKDKDEEKRNSIDEGKKDVFEREKEKSKMDKKQTRRYKLREKYERKQKDKQEKDQEERRASIDSIKKEIPVRQTDYNESRKHLLLGLFVRHFIAMSEKFLENKIFYQASIYLEHSEALISLWNIVAPRQVPEDLIKKLKQLREEHNREKDRYVAPPLPARHSQIINLNSRPTEEITATIDLNQNNNDEAQISQEHDKKPTEIEDQSQNEENPIETEPKQIKTEKNSTEIEDQSQNEENPIETEPKQIKTDKTSTEIDLNQMEIDSDQSTIDEINLDQSKIDLRQTEMPEIVVQNFDPVQIVPSDEDILNIKLKHVEVAKKVETEADVEVSSSFLLKSIKSDKKSILKNSVKINKEEKQKIETNGVKFVDDSDSDECTDL